MSITSMSIPAQWIRGAFRSFKMFCRKGAVTGDLMALIDAIHNQFIVISDSICFKERQTILKVTNFFPRTKEEKTY